MPLTKDTELLQQILKYIDPEESDENEIKSEAFDLTHVFVAKYFKEDFCQIIINSIDTSTDLRKVGRLLDILIWSTPDNGKKLDQLTADWIKSNDQTKIEIQLSRKDWLPESKDWEFTSAIIKKEFPRLKGLCEYHDEEIGYWEKTGGRRMDKLQEELKKINC